MRVHVYIYGDSIDTLSSHAHVSKSTAVRWVSWGTHAWISRKAIQERYPEPFRTIPNRVIPPLVTRYSPDHMPPLEVAQVHFEEPRSAAWLLAHRTVILPHAEEQWLES